MTRKKPFIKFQRRANLRAILSLNSILMRLKYMIRLQEIIDLNWLFKKHRSMLQNLKIRVWMSWLRLKLLINIWTWLWRCMQMNSWMRLFLKKMTIKTSWSGHLMKNNRTCISLGDLKALMFHICFNWKMSIMDHKRPRLNLTLSMKGDGNILNA
jgi:hypothetical protein